ncbi:MAG: cell surface protein SprA [Crocinitomicaceae bacterium]|nr:cell surface protein SprA [Crocinitomicaceae bacterium]
MKWTAVMLLLCLCTGYALGQSVDTNGVELPFPVENNIDPTQSGSQSFDLGDPSSVEQTIVYDPETGTYVFKETIGTSELNFRNPSMMTLEEYIEYERQKALAENWQDKIDEQTEESQPFELPIKVGSKVFENFFGSDEIVIRPAGSVEISFGVNSSRYDNPILPVNQRRNTRFDFQQQINLDLVGQIGTKLKIGTQYNTQAAFDFDNQQKLEYVGDEDQIMQKIALGNVALELPTSLIQGSQTLFGAYTQLKFGRTSVDLIAASSKGRRQEINITGKSQTQEFELTADNYEQNRHYFLNMYHHDNYDVGMSTLPIANTTINLSRIEVWVMNRTNETENTRNIIAFSDLGEAKPENCEGDPGAYTTGQVNGDLPDNNANGLYSWASTNPQVRSFNNASNTLASQVVAPGPFQQAKHYEKVENARKLNESEFTYNAQLGFISLNMPLNNDEVLAVAYEYTQRGETYQVGEFSTDGIVGQEALLLKLLKPTITNPKNKVWKLMMKNVYSIGAYQVDQQGFRMDILYNNPETSVLVPFFPLDGVDDLQLVTLLEMDKLNVNYQPFSDGVLDFVPITFNGSRAENAGTINVRNGRIYFSTVEPFGQTLANKLAAENVPQVTIDRLAYTELYDSTKTAAQQIPSKNRFSFKGEYQSSISSDIPLNALNVPEGAVSVTAGGIKLQEGSDYTVDYNLGRVKILNEAYLNANTPIKISIESNSVFGFQAKSLIGSRVAHRFSDEFNIGATWMRMMERPVTQKVDFGSEPYKNNVLGIDLAYRTEVPLFTKLVDALPVISTKEKSSLSFTGEFAHLIPGTPKAISKEGISYIDDFEGAQSAIDLRSFTAWRLASVPKGQPDLFPEASNLDLSAGYKRAKTAWYVVDPLFFQSNSLTPDHMVNNPEQLEDSRIRIVNQTDIFPFQQQAYGALPNIPVLDLAYYPKERGMYNYDTTNTVNSDGTFTDPENRWGGIMRALSTNDFEQTNIEFIQFWMLDPFNQDAEDENPNSQHSGGDLYFNLGNLSEDILPDSRRSFENGLPPFGAGVDDPVDETPWARVSTLQQTVNAFDNDPNARVNQDVGIDGWGNADERLFYSDYVNWVQNNPTLDATAKSRMIADPSTDDYNYYRDDIYDRDELTVLERYKKYNGMEGNSPTVEMSDTANVDGYPTQGTNLPDIEEFNNNNTLDETESYFQYRVSLRKGELQEGQNFITNVQDYTNGTKTERWYQFKVPIAEFEKRVNGIQDFRTIRFMRMFLKGFDEEVVVRFARLELIRGEWRRYLEDLTEPGDGVTVDPNLTTFNIGAVNIEENSERSPIPYVEPPEIVREVDPSQTYQRQLNEQALTLEVCDLQDGDARAAYRNVQFDVRTYKKLKMFVHAEEVMKSKPLNDDDLTLFVRLGTDFTDNYYEYELPLKVTDWGASVDTDIWPEANNVEIVFDDLLDLKKARNALIESGTGSVSYITEYEIVDPANTTRRLKVKGSPNLQGLKTIMVGVRNPKDNSGNPWADDGLAKCAQIWINELRLSDFVSEGGSAAVAQMQMQFADFASVNMSGNYSGINWGAVDSRVQERQRNEQIGFDMNASVQLGQFFGRRSRVSLPFFYGYSLGIINPEYDPFNPDIKLKDYDVATRKERARLGQDFTERKSYNFTNVRKELKAGAKNHFWRISNWSTSYAYSESLMRDFNTNYDRTKTWTSGLNYNYSFGSKPITPFRKSKFLKKSKWFALIRDANFYLAPKNISFSNDLIRMYNERQIRNNLVPDYEFRPVYVKRFNWNRKYGIAYDLTKKLKLTFNATNQSIFTERDGQVDRRGDDVLYNAFKDTVGQQLRTLGTAMDYSHNYTIKYSLPFEKIPVTDWVSANVTWKGSYNWQRGPLAQQEDYGNIIQNSRNVNFATQLNFTSLYNKVPFFKKVNNNGRNPRGRASATDKDGAKRGGKNEKPKDAKPRSEMTEKEKKAADKEKKKKEKEKKRGGKVHPIAGFGARLLMSVRNVSGTYAITDGTLLPGYNQDVGVLGFNPQFSSGMSGFIFGQQRYNVWGQETGYNAATRIESEGWLVQNENINQQYTNTHTQNLNLRASLQPIKDLSIELTANRTYGNNSSEFYRWNSLSGPIDPITGNPTGQYESQSRIDIATLSYSNVSIGSAFALIGKSYESAVFDDFLTNRTETSQLLGANNNNSSLLSSGYAEGYGGSQQEVLVGSFLTTYTNRGINEKNINPVRNLPLPNWSMNYNGLKKFPFMKKRVKNFVIRHAYSSSITVSGMQTNLNAEFDANGHAITPDLNGNFLAANQVQNVVVSERFSPLIGLDATWLVNGQGLITKFEYKKDRNSTLSLNNNQITEILGNEWVVGTGYRFAKVKVKVGKQKLESPVNLRVDISFRDNLTVIRKVGDDENAPSNQATAGQKVIAIKSSADYSLNKNLVIQFYYDQTLNTPKIATSYPTGSLNTGIRIRFNLAGVQ